MRQLAIEYLRVAIRLLEKAERDPAIAKHLDAQALKETMRALEEMGRAT